MPSGHIPVAVLVARLEHRLETARLVLDATLGEHGPARRAVADAQDLAQQIREAL